MPSAGPRFLFTLCCIVCLFGGCAGVPPVPEHARNSPKPAGDDDEGWLFKRLTGRQEAAAATEKSAPAEAASATAPQTEPIGPMVAGPSSHGGPYSRTAPELTPGTPETIAGPPPSIPAALPPPPDGGVSINAATAKAEEQKKGFELTDLAPENIFQSMKNAAGYGPNEKIAREAMKEGESLFREKKYKDAAAKFGVAAARRPDSPLEEDALFLKGESEFFADLYPKAHDTYGGLLKKYTNTRHLDTVMARQFALGRYWEQLYDKKPTLPVAPNFTDRERPMFDTFGYAVQAYQRIRQHDPTGPLADDSLLALGNAYFRRGQFEDAANQYDLLRKEYSNSEHQMKAHLLGLQAKMRVYQGTGYDDAPLKEGEKIAAQSLSQFGDKLGEERKRVEQAHAQIVEELANRDFVIAQYYEQRESFGAARMYYRGVVKDYPRSHKAKDALARLDAIGGKPDDPPERFAWFTDVLDPKTK